MTHAAPPLDQDLGAEVSGTHQRALEKVFQHPLTHNLTWREVTHLFETIGAAEQKHNGDLMLRLGGEHLSFKPMRGKDLGASEVMEVRHLLVRGGWSNESAKPMTQATPVAPDLLIVIDHAGARLYPLHAESPTLAAEEPHHLHHQHIGRKDHDADRAETYPSDVKFFASVAADLPKEGRIVLVSHGAGQSNEAGHLIDYLRQNHPGVPGRIVANLVADLPHMTAPQIVRLARDALGAAPIPTVGDPS